MIARIRTSGALKSSLRTVLPRKWRNSLPRKHIARKATALYLLSNGYVIVEYQHRGERKQSFYRYHGVALHLRNPKHGSNGFEIR